MDRRREGGREGGRDGAREGGREGGGERVRESFVDYIIIIDYLYLYIHFLATINNSSHRTVISYIRGSVLQSQVEHRQLLSAAGLQQQFPATAVQAESAEGWPAGGRDAVMPRPGACTHIIIMTTAHDSYTRTL